MTRIRSMLWAAGVMVLVMARVAPGQVRVPSDRAACVPGSILVLPIAFDDGANPRAPVRVELADGRSLVARVTRLVSTPISGPISPIESWMGRPMHWRSEPADRVDPRDFDASVWVLAVQTPADASGATLTVAGEPIRVAWLADPGVGDGVLGWRAALDDPAGLARLGLAHRLDPMLSWRGELLGGGGRAIDDELVAALAGQQTTLWRVGLDRLWRHDEALAGSLVRALWATVRFEASTRVPVWTSDPNRLDELLWTLIDDRLDDRTRDRRVRTWIGDEPASVVWVIDDAGRSSAVRIGAANLTSEAMLAWATRRGEAIPPDPARVLPGGAIELSTPAGDTSQSATGVWQLHLGSHSAVRQIVAGPVGLVPPGLTIGPLLADWTLDDWTHSVVAPVPDPTRAAVARLVWIADELETPIDERQGVVVHRRADRGGHLAIYLECAGSNQQAGDDTVRVWIGPAGAPRAVLRVSGSGTMSDELTRSAPTPLTIVRSVDRWAALVPIPVGVLASDGTLRLGIERIDPLGQRSAWPRRMLPWQREPGRIRVDPGAWDGLSTPDQGERDGT